jgi:hypothetical protein
MGDFIAGILWDVAGLMIYGTGRLLLRIFGIEPPEWASVLVGILTWLAVLVVIVMVARHNAVQ